MKKARLVNKEEIDNIREGLKVALDELRKNYIAGAVVAPKGTEIKDYITVSMRVTGEDIENFSLGLYVCDAVEKIMNNEYDTKDVLYLLDAENKLSTYLSSVEYKYNIRPMGVEVPDRYFVKVAHLMCSRIRDNLEITVKL